MHAHCKSSRLLQHSHLQVDNSASVGPFLSGRMDSLTADFKVPMRPNMSARQSETASKAHLTPPPAPPAHKLQMLWRPYEAAPRENMVLWWLPRRFYQLRWVLMRNPLAWRMPGWRSHTIGEVLVFVLIFAQAAWMAIMWGGNFQGYRYDVCVTGAAFLRTLKGHSDHC